jgi:hypothetical protein
MDGVAAKMAETDDVLADEAVVCLVERQMLG